MNKKVSESSSSQFLLPKVPNIGKRNNYNRLSQRGNGSSDSGAETSDSDDRTCGSEWLQCSWCAYRVCDLNEYVNHLRSHHNVQTVECGICHQSFSLASYLSHSSKCKGSYLCDHCGATFAQKSYLQRHISRIHMKSNCGFLCDICGQVLSTNNNLKQHKLIHSDNIQFTCEFCNKGFFQKIHYNSHLDSKHSKSELAHINKPFVCYICKDSFLFQTSLQQHLNQYCCKKEKRYNCRSCDKSFIYPSELKRHEYVHVSKYDRVYSCPYCNKTYNRLYQFVEHLLFHKNTSAFKCPKCDKILSELSYLKKHYRRHFADTSTITEKKVDSVLPHDMLMNDNVSLQVENDFGVDDDESVAMIDNFIEEVWSRFHPHLDDDNPLSISFDDFKLDLWEEFLSESTYTDTT